MPENYTQVLSLAKNELRQARLLLDTEIRTYPTPISGCDAAFNHLLADRERIHRALAALGEEVFVPTPRTPTMDAGVESR